MTDENIYVVIEDNEWMLPECEGDDAGKIYQNISDVIEPTDMGSPDRDLEVKTEGTMLPAPAL